jgi:hypothetical protein
LTIKKRNFVIGIWSLVFWFSPCSLCLRGWKFGGAIGAAARLEKISLKMADIKVTATVRMHKEESGFFIDAALDTELAGGARAAGRSARREGAHDLPVLESDARQYRGETFGEWEAG